MKKGKSNLEQLLNSLIERGWKPFGNKPLTELKKNVKIEKYNRKIIAVIIKNGRKYADDYYSPRDLVSKESGLWQFVCENGMVEHRNYWVDTEIGQDEQYKYRLIESSLRDESELEDFLLQNIKLGNED